MARSPDERVIQAEKMFLAGAKLIEIATQLEVPEGTVRSWKNRYKWGNATLQKEKCNVAKPKTHKKRSDKLLINHVLENPELNDNQRLFCILYAKTLNATRSYKKAYGCSYETAMVNGSALLRNTKVKEEIQRLKKERFENQLFDEHDIFQWYLDIATASITDFVEFGREKVPVMAIYGPVQVEDPETGEKVQLMKEVNYVKFLPSSEVDGRIVKKVKMGRDGASIELHDAMKAMEWLTEHMSMGTAGQQSLASNIMSAWERRKAQLDPGNKEGEVKDVG